MVSPWKLFVVSISLMVPLCLWGTEDVSSRVSFPKDKIRLNAQTLVVEFAKSEEQHRRGLMYRTSLKENEGMLFIFPTEEIRSFWMKNTYIDLSIGYFDKNKALVDVQEMKAPSMMEKYPPSYPSAKPAMYALEMNKGWFVKNKVKVGQKFEFIKR